MATRTTVTLTDDLNPNEPASETIAFRLDGTSYEIDLSDKHSDEFRSVLDKYIGSARKVGRGRVSTPSTSSRSRRSDLAQLRAWAASNGVELNTRGRIAAAVTAAFDAKDVAALRAATGQAEEPAKPARRRRRRKATSESSA